MKKLLLGLMLIALMILSGCDEDNHLEGYGQAIFYLEGGSSQSTHERLSYYYQIEDEDTVLIYEPNTLIENEDHQIKRTGYHIEGWYQTKNSDGTYADKWDFAVDKMGIEGVTLYANWEVNVVYTYALYYKDSNNNDVLLSSYVAKEGEKFMERKLDKKTVEGYTSLGYLDANGNPWDSNYRMEKADVDTEVKIYLDLIEGEYTVVKDARGLESALTKNADIYLLNDIDYEGKQINLDSYSGKLNGNNHKIFNAKYSVRTAGIDTKDNLEADIDNPSSAKTYLYVSLFRELKNATLTNVSFEDITLVIDTNFSSITEIIVSPLAKYASGTTLENVKVNISYEFTTNLNCEITTVLDKHFFKEENNTIDSNSTVVVTSNRAN